jgi:hypothetical protein
MNDTASWLIDRLEERDLAERRTPPTDRPVKLAGRNVGLRVFNGRYDGGFAIYRGRYQGRGRP